MKEVSLDLRERILAAYDAKEGTRVDIAIRFPGVSGYGQEAYFAASTR